MKKRILLTMLAAVLLLTLSGCACEHQWVEADCLTPQTCSLCEKTEGDPLGHDWLAADCVQPVHCARCAATEGDPLGHTFAEATCAAPKTCTLCGLTEGEPSAHSYDVWVVEDEQASRRCLGCEAVEQADVTALLLGEWYIVGGYQGEAVLTASELGLDGIDLLWFSFAADGTGILGSSVMDPQETPCVWQLAEVHTTENGTGLLIAVDMLIGEEPQMRVVLCTDDEDFHWIVAPGLGLCDVLLMTQLEKE